MNQRDVKRLKSLLKYHQYDRKGYGEKPDYPKYKIQVVSLLNKLKGL